jgi:hypothetical protein
MERRITRMVYRGREKLGSGECAELALVPIPAVG